MSLILTHNVDIGDIHILKKLEGKIYKIIIYPSDGPKIPCEGIIHEINDRLVLETLLGNIELPKSDEDNIRKFYF